MEVFTYNNGTVSVDNPDLYMSLVLHDDSVDYQLDEDELIFYANVSLEPHSTATLIIDARVRDESELRLTFRQVVKSDWNLSRAFSQINNNFADVGCVGPCENPDSSGNCPYYMDPEYPGCCEGWQLAYWAPDNYWYCYKLVQRN